MKMYQKQKLRQLRGKREREREQECKSWKDGRVEGDRVS